MNLKCVRQVIFCERQITSSLPVSFGDSHTIDLYWMHRAEGTEHFHSLKTTRWPVARKNILVFRQEHIRPAIYLSISESPRLRICLSTRIPALQKQLLVRSGTNV